MLGQRRPSPEIYSLVVSNTQDENGEYDQLRLNVGSAYEVRIPRGQTTFARIEGIAPTDIPRAYNVRVMWLYKKADALNVITNPDVQRTIRTAAPNMLYLSNHLAEVSTDTILGPVSLVHSDLSQGFYGRALTAGQLRDIRDFVFDHFLDIVRPSLTPVPVPPLNSVEAGLYLNQPSTESVEQLRTLIGEGFFKMKPTTGGHRVSYIVDADFAALADLVATVPHIRTRATVKVVNPTHEELAVLCQEEYLTKLCEAEDIIRCTVLPHTVKLVFYLNTFRLSLNFSYVRERKVGRKWNPLDNAMVREIREGVIQVAMGDHIVTGDLEGGGLPVDSLTTLKDVRWLLDLHNIASRAESDTMSFHKDDCMVTARREGDILVLDAPDVVYRLRQV
mmetsp:Transcript_7388/g.15070  ORF Transcript_7388/g.15070 Transcript_7388/m.15070 type:complete len:391 (-) Transcript_7388:707-1879(-)